MTSRLRRGNIVLKLFHCTSSVVALLASRAGKADQKKHHLIKAAATVVRTQTRAMILI